MIHWNYDPALFTIGFFSLRWYSLFFLASFYLSFAYLKRRFINAGYDPFRLDSLLMYMMFSTIIGARLGHCFFYEPEVYLAEPLRILKVWEGGLASHGAAIGIPIGAYLFNRKFKDMNYLWLMDRICTAVAISGGLIRLGNLMNSEIIGAPTNGKWGFIFDRVDNIPRHPTQIYESVAYFAIALILHFVVTSEKWGRKRGFALGSFLILVFGFRFCIEFIKDVQVTFERNLSLDMGQILSIPAVIIGIILVVTSFGRIEPERNS